MTSEERLEELERQFARAKWQSLWAMGVGGVLIVGLGLALVGIWTKTTTVPRDQGKGAVAKVVRAGAFVLEDPNGAERARLQTTRYGSALHLITGKDRMGGVSLAADHDGTTLLLNDESGGRSIHLSVTKDASRLSFWDSKTPGGVTLNASRAGSDLILRDASGKVFDGTDAASAMLSANWQGSSLTMHGVGGKGNAMLWVGGVGGTRLGLSDENSKTRTLIELGRAILYDKEGQYRMMLGGGESIASNGTKVRLPESTLLLINADGTPRWSAP
jgi:hypothetical protein